MFLLSNSQGIPATLPGENISLNIFLFINTDTIHVNINIFQLGFRKKSKTYMNLSPINFEQNTCYGE